VSASKSTTKKRRGAQIEVTKETAELLALRKLVITAEHIFDAEGVTLVDTAMTPLEILSEALRSAKSDFAVIGDADMSCSGSDSSMVYRRAELRIDLALALAKYRKEFPSESEATDG